MSILKNKSHAGYLPIISVTGLIETVMLEGNR